MADNNNQANSTDPSSAAECINCQLIPSPICTAGTTKLTPLLVSHAGHAAGHASKYMICSEARPINIFCDTDQHVSVRLFIAHNGKSICRWCLSQFTAKEQKDLDYVFTYIHNLGLDDSDG